MLEKSKFGKILKIIASYFLPWFCLAVFTISIVLVLLHIQVARIPLSITLIIGLTAGAILSVIRFKKIPTENKNIIIEWAESIFTLSLLLVTTLKIGLLNQPTLLQSNYLSITLIYIAITAGFLSLHNKNLGNEIGSRKSTEEYHINENTEKNLGLRVKILKILRPHTLLILVTVFFLAVKVAMIISYHGNYVDEYFHIFSATEFLKTGHFAEIYLGDLYSRGSYLTLLVALTFKALGPSALIAKIVPALIGIINFWLLYLIGKRVLEKNQVNLLLLCYTLSPWVIFNHYYIRVYVFYELIFLALTLIIIKRKEYIALILALAFFYLDQYSTAGQLFIAYTLVATFFQKKLFKHWKKSLIFMPWILATSVLWIPRVLSFFHGYLYYTSPDDVKYQNIFFNWSITLTVIICIFFLSQIKNRQGNKSLLTAIPILLFVHLISPKSLQINRAITYIYPLLYLCYLDLTSRFSGSLKHVLRVLLPVSIIIIYPNFYVDKAFGLPNEIAYIDNSVYRDAQELCSDKVLYVSARPGASEIFNLHPVYYINTKYADLDWVANNEDSGENKLFYIENGTYYDTYTHIPVITDYKEFVSKQSVPACIIMGGLPYSWVNDQIRSYISENYEEFGYYHTNYDSSRMHLFIRTK